MGPSRSWISASAFVVACLLAGAANAGLCRPGNPMGRYEGAAKNAGAPLAMTLNLACNGGVYAPRFFTDQGDFDGQDASFAKGVLTLKFDAGWGPVTARLTRNGDKLTGAADIGGAHVPLAFTLVAPAWTQDDWRANLDLTPAQWREDLAFLATEVPKRHAKAFATLPEAQWKAKVAALDARIPKLGPDQTLVAFTQLINAIGDGHTQIVGSPEPEAMPLELTQIDGAFRVTGAGPGLEKALGTRVLAIGKTSIGRAHSLALTLTPTNELAPLREGRANYFLTRGDLMHGLGIIQDREVAAYKLQDDGGPAFTLEVHGLPAHSDPPMTRLGVDRRIAPPAGKPSPFWCKALSDAVYCDWTAYDDLAANAKAMWGLIDQTKPNRLILDMRDNGGGDNTVGAAVLVNPDQGARRPQPEGPALHPDRAPDLLSGDEQRRPVPGHDQRHPGWPDDRREAQFLPGAATVPPAQLPPDRARLDPVVRLPQDPDPMSSRPTRRSPPPGPT